MMDGLPKKTHPLRAAQLMPANMQEGSFAKMKTWISEIESYEDVEKSTKVDIPQSVALAITEVRPPRFSEDGYSDCLQRIEISDVPRQELEKALQVLIEVNQECGKEVAIALLTALGLDTNTHQLNDFPNRLTSYASKLALYPIDVAAAACKSISETSKWFPAWAEIFEGVEWRVRSRRLRRDAVIAKIGSM